MSRINFQRWKAILQDPQTRYYLISDETKFKQLLSQYSKQPIPGNIITKEKFRQIQPNSDFYRKNIKPFIDAISNNRYITTSEAKGNYKEIIFLEKEKTNYLSGSTISPTGHPRYPNEAYTVHHDKHAHKLRVYYAKIKFKNGKIQDAIFIFRSKARPISTKQYLRLLKYPQTWQDREALKLIFKGVIQDFKTITRRILKTVTRIPRISYVAVVPPEILKACGVYQTYQEI